MRPEIEPKTYKSVDARISRLFPIRHALIFKWEFDKAKDWEDVKRFVGKYYYWIEAPFSQHQLSQYRDSKEKRGDDSDKHAQKSKEWGRSIWKEIRDLK